LDVQEMARERTPQAIEALTLALSNPRERVAAAIALLDRGWGKPQQPISGDANAPLLVDFTWAAAMPVNGDNEAAAPAPEPLVIEATAEPEAEGDDTEDAGLPVIRWGV
jgi:hypothetical protein